MAFEYASTGAQGYILKILGQHFGLPLQRVKEELSDERSHASIKDFLAGDEGVVKLVFFYQSRDQHTEDGEVIENSGACCTAATRAAHCRRDAPAQTARQQHRRTLPPRCNFFCFCCARLRGR